MENINIKGIEQGRAKFAYDCVSFAIANLEHKKQKEFKSYVKKIPMLIKTNGLGATYAFILSKGKNDEKNAYHVIYQKTAEWIKTDKKIITEDFKDLSDMIIQQPSPTYRALTNEVLALFNWLRRFAEGLIEGEEDN